MRVEVVPLPMRLFGQIFRVLMKPSGAWLGQGANLLNNNLDKESYVGRKFGLLIPWLKEF